MNKEKNINAEYEQDGDYSVKGNRKFNVFAYVMCVVAAIFIWLLIMNLDHEKAPGETVPSESETEAAVLFLTDDNI